MTSLLVAMSVPVKIPRLIPGHALAPDRCCTARTTDHVVKERDVQVVGWRPDGIPCCSATTVKGLRITMCPVRLASSRRFGAPNIASMVLAIPWKTTTSGVGVLPS